MASTLPARRNRVFKSLHKPLTYMGIERTLFFFVCVGAVGCFNLFNSILAGIVVFVGGAIFGHWVTNADPAFLTHSGQVREVQGPVRRREAASPKRGDSLMLNLRKVIKPWKESGALNANINLYGFWRRRVPDQDRRSGHGAACSRRGLREPRFRRATVCRYAAWKRLSKRSAKASTSTSTCSRPTGLRFRLPATGMRLSTPPSDQRREYFESKRDHLYRIEIFYVVLLEGSRSKTGITAALKRFPRDPDGAMRELKAQFSSSGTKVLLRKQIMADLDNLRSRVENFHSASGRLHADRGGGPTGAVHVLSPSAQLR